MALLFLSTTAKAQELVNGGFEITDNNSHPRNWDYYNDGNHYKINEDTQIRHSGKTSLSIDGTEYKEASSKNTAIVAGTYGATSDKKLKEIELSAWIRTEKSTDSLAAIFIQSMDGSQIIKKFPTSPVAGKWAKVVLDFKVDGTQNWYGFYYGIEVARQGKIWLDDFSLKIDGKEIKEPEAFDFTLSKKDKHWLDSHLHPIQSVEAAASNADLEPIGNQYPEARIIGIGEATHGTSEAFKLKFRILKYLVEEKGFTTFAMEEVIANCDALEKAINDPNASIKETLAALPFYKIWKTDEMLDMLEWIRSYNSSHPKKIRFVGFDMEDKRIKMSRQLLAEYGQQHNKDIYKQAQLLDEKLEKLLAESAKENNDAKTLELANDFDTTLEKTKELITQQLDIDKEQSFKLLTYLRTCEQWLSTRFPIGTAAANRDAFMAENIEYYTAAHPDEKIVLWAHNAHIANIASSALKTSMGGHLKAYYKNAYVPLGFATAKGKYLAAENYSQKVWNAYDFEPAYKGTYEYVLQQAKAPLYFLSLQGEKQDWMQMQMQQLNKAYIYAKNDYEFLGGPINSLFDGILFSNETTASHLLK